MKLDHCIAPEIGILVENAGATSADKAGIVTNILKSRYIRTAVQVYSWNGTNSPVYDVNAGLLLKQHVVLRTFVTGAGPQPWITDAGDLLDYADTVDEILAAYPELRVVIIDNEEMNTDYHSGTLAEYIAQCEAIKDVCKAHNVLIANAGIGDFYAIHAFAFRYVKAKYGQVTADAFGDEVFLSPGQYNAANNPGSNPSLEQKITDISALVAADVFDVFNFHMYEPIGDQTNASDAIAAKDVCWRYYKEAFENGHPTKRRYVMCNEVGPRESEHEELVTSMLQCAWKHGYFFFDIWSGNGLILNTVPLTEDDGSIKPNGQAYADWQDQHYENISLV